MHVRFRFASALAFQVQAGFRPVFLLNVKDACRFSFRFLL